MFSFPFKDDPFFSDHVFPEHSDRLAIGSGNDGFLQPFQHNMDRSFNQMRRLMDDMTSGMRNEMSLDGRNGHSYVQSSVYSYSRNADGEPEIYEAHQSNRHGPGGLREEKKALRDSRKKLEKMAVGRHLGERGHVVERSKNMETGQMSQHQNLIGIGEDEVDAYQREWQDKTRDWDAPSSRYRGLGVGRAEQPKRQHALEYNKHKHQSSNRRH